MKLEKLNNDIKNIFKNDSSYFKQNPVKITISFGTKVIENFEELLQNIEISDK